MTYLSLSFTLSKLSDPYFFFIDLVNYTVHPYKSPLKSSIPHFKSLLLAYTTSSSFANPYKVIALFKRGSSFSVSAFPLLSNLESILVRILRSSYTESNPCIISFSLLHYSYVDAWQSMISHLDWIGENPAAFDIDQVWVKLLE